MLSISSQGPILRNEANNEFDDAESVAHKRLQNSQDTEALELYLRHRVFCHPFWESHCLLGLFNCHVPAVIFIYMVLSIEQTHYVRVITLWYGHDISCLLAPSECCCPGLVRQIVRDSARDQEPPDAHESQVMCVR